MRTPAAVPLGALARRAGRRVVDHVLVDPVTEGRLRRHDWPAGLAPTVAVGAVLCALMVVLTGSAGLLRRSSTMVFRPPDLTAPGWVLPLFVPVLVFATATLYVAALHVRVLVRVPLLVVLVAVLVEPGADLGSVAAAVPLWVTAALAVGFAVVRWRARFAAAELVVGVLLFGVGIGYGLLAIDARYGVVVPDAAYNEFTGTSGTIWALAGPFAALAGATVTELLASTTSAVGQAVAEATGRLRRPQRWLVAGLAVLAIARLVQLVHAGATDDDYRPLPLLLGALPLLVPLLVLAGRRLTARPGARTARRAGPDAEGVLGDWTRWALLASAALIAVALWPVVGADLSHAFGWETGAAWFAGIDVQVGYLVTTPPAAALVLAVAVRHRRRTGRWSPVLIMVGWLMLVRTLYTATGVLGSVPGALGLAAVLAIVLAVVLVVRRQLTPGRAGALAGVLLLTGLYDYRDAITEPLTAALALAGGSVALMVGVVWRVLTDSAFGNGDSARFPRPARVLLVCANTVFGAGAVALLTLQGGVSATNLALFEQLGDSQLGFTLVVAVLLALLVTAGARDRSASEPVGQAVAPVGQHDGGGGEQLAAEQAGQQQGATEGERVEQPD